MDSETAISLARRISLHWGSLTKSQVDYWAEELQPLEEGAAGTAFAKLKSSAHRPTLGEFLEQYRSLHTHDAGNRPERCELCGDTGLITDLDHPRHWSGPVATIPPVNDDGSCNCNCATWCGHCPEGEKRRDMFARHNRHRVSR